MGHGDLEPNACKQVGCFYRSLRIQLHKRVYQVDVFLRFGTRREK